MSTIVLELPDEQLEALERVADAQGASVNDVILDLIATLVTRPGTEHEDIVSDPIYNIRSHESAAPPDLSQNVDHYLCGSSF
jgi:hypothetical protein